MGWHGEGTYAELVSYALPPPGRPENLHHIKCTRLNGQKFQVKHADGATREPNSTKNWVFTERPCHWELCHMHKGLG